MNCAVAAFAAFAAWRDSQTILSTPWMLMWYSENCFEVWSAHLLPQTGHDLGMKSCMIGMHGLHILFNNIRWNVGPCVVWKCIGTWRNMLPTYLRIVGYPAFWCGRAGGITLLVVLETLGTLRYRTFAGINNWATGGPWQGMRTGGQIWCHSSCSFAPNHEQDHLKGINVYIALLFFTCALHGLPAGIQVSLHFTISQHQGTVRSKRTGLATAGGKGPNYFGDTMLMKFFGWRVCVHGQCYLWRRLLELDSGISRRQFSQHYVTCNFFIRSHDDVCSMYHCVWSRLRNVACRVDGWPLPASINRLACRTHQHVFFLVVEIGRRQIEGLTAFLRYGDTMLKQKHSCLSGIETLRTGEWRDKDKEDFSKGSILSPNGKSSIWKL